MPEDLKQNSKNQKEPEQSPDLAPQAISPKEESTEQPQQAKEEKPQQEKQVNQSFWIILFFIAGVKDLLEFIFGLIPIIGSLLVWIVSFLLGGLIIFLLFISGNYKKLKQAQFFLMLIGQLGDVVPILNILPLSTLTIFIMYFLSKNQALSSSLEKLQKVRIQ